MKPRASSESTARTADPKIKSSILSEIKIHTNISVASAIICLQVVFDSVLLFYLRQSAQHTNILPHCERYTLSLVCSRGLACPLTAIVFVITDVNVVLP